MKLQSLENIISQYIIPGKQFSHRGLKKPFSIFAPFRSFLKKKEMSKIMLDILEERIYNEQAFRDGRLAQLVAHPLDVREVTSSSLVSSTMNSSPKGEEFFFFCHFLL